LYIIAVILLSAKFGIIGLIYANCVNMAIRAVMSLQISLNNSRDKNSVFEVASKVIQNKVFIGLISSGVAGTFGAKIAIKYILIKLNKL
jgi:hypothetical protein